MAQKKKILKYIIKINIFSLLEAQKPNKIATEQEVATSSCIRLCLQRLLNLPPLYKQPHLSWHLRVPPEVPLLVAIAFI